MDFNTDSNRISENTAVSYTEEKNSEHHHHHHHHHHSDGEHHHHSESSSNKYHKSDVKHKKKSLKSLFKKSRVSEKKKDEPQINRILKKIFILLLILGLFSWSFYNIFIKKLSDEKNEGELKLPTQTELLKSQLIEAQEKIKTLEEELAAYKEAFGELDIEPKE